MSESKSIEWRPEDAAPYCKLLRIRLPDGSEAVGFRATYYQDYWRMAVINDRPSGNQGPTMEGACCFPTGWREL